MTVFENLSSVNVNGKTEKKGNLTYLSWAYAWGELKKRYPARTYTVYENADGWNYFTDGRTGWVKTGVTVEGIEYIEYLPIMDAKNKSIPAGQIDSFTVNKTIQRSLTKAIARHGLGLYIYAGEDLPDDPAPEKEIDLQEKVEQNRERLRKAEEAKKARVPKCETCKKEITLREANQSAEIFDGHIFCSMQCRHKSDYWKETFEDEEDDE